MKRSSHKYHAQRTTVDGHTFASKAEARRYSELVLLAKAGKIECLELQPSFALIVNGQQVGRYVADFRYYDMTTGAQITEDVKGVVTQTYALKKKMVEALYGISITEIGRAKKAATRKGKR